MPSQECASPPRLPGAMQTSANLKCSTQATVFVLLLEVICYLEATFDREYLLFYLTFLSTLYPLSQIHF